MCAVNSKYLFSPAPIQNCKPCLSVRLEVMPARAVTIPAGLRTSTPRKRVSPSMVVAPPHFIFCCCVSRVFFIVSVQF